MSATVHRHLVTDGQSGMRLDRLCAELHPEHSRSRLASLIRDRRVVVDGLPARPGERVSAGQSVELTIPPRVDTRIEAEPIPLAVIHEDDDILVIDKAAGMVVHPGAGVTRGTLAAALLHHHPEVAGVGGEGRGGLVHRLDRGTTGVMVVARHDAAHRALSGQFRQRTVAKRYDAVVWGRPRHSEGEIDAPIGRDPRHRLKMSTRAPRARAARSRYQVVAEVPGFALVEVTIETGRTHQIRVHMATLGYPLVGDLAYAGDRTRGLVDPARRQLIRSFARPALHARALALDHPGTGRRVTFEAPWPDDLAQLWRGLGGVRPG